MAPRRAPSHLPVCRMRQHAGIFAVSTLFAGSDNGELMFRMPILLILSSSIASASDRAVDAHVTWVEPNYLSDQVIPQIDTNAGSARQEPESSGPREVPIYRQRPPTLRQCLWLL